MSESRTPQNSESQLSDVTSAASSSVSGSPVTSVLLPAARIALHITDTDLLATARELVSDWRFARVTFDIRSGDIESAISYYENQTSPELVIVETASIGEEFTAKLGVLAGNCAENTSAIVVGPVNDVYLYRKLIEMGVSDYLVKPISKPVLTEMIAKALIDKLGASDSKLVALIGAKGGVGTTAIAQGLAWAMSEDFGEKTAILDAAGGWSYLSVGFGHEPVTSLQEVTRAVASTDQDALNRMLISISDKLTVLGTGIDMMLDDTVGTNVFENILNRLMITHPVVIVDLSGASPSIKRIVMTKAHHIHIVATPTLPALRSARTLLQEIKNLKGQIENGVSLILNKVGQHALAEVAGTDIEKAMERKPAAILTYNPKAFLGAETQGKRLSEISGGEAIAQSILQLAKQTLSKDIKKAEIKLPSKLGGFLNRMKGRKSNVLR